MPVTPVVKRSPNASTSAARFFATDAASAPLTDCGAPRASAIAFEVCEPWAEVPKHECPLRLPFTQGLYPPAVALKYRAWNARTPSLWRTPHFCASALFPSASATSDMYPREST